MIRGGTVPCDKGIFPRCATRSRHKEATRKCVTGTGAVDTCWQGMSGTGS